MMIFALCASAFSWPFASYDDLEMKCAICNRVVLYHQKNPGAGLLRPIEGSACKSENASKICRFIEDISNQSISLSRRGSISRLCYLTNSCDPPLPQDYIGSRCRSCISMTLHLLRHPVDDRKSAFYRFCFTNKPIPSSLCGDIIDEGVDDFLSDLIDIGDANGACVSSHFCRRKAVAQSKEL